MVVISVYTYGVKIIKKFRWESGFLGGIPWTPPPLCTNGSAGYLMQLSVNKHYYICPASMYDAYMYISNDNE